MGPLKCKCSCSSHILNNKNISEVALGLSFFLGREERRKGGRKGGRERREGRKSSNERDIAELDLEVYKLISFFSFFERRKEKKGGKERKKEEEKEGERREMLLYSKKNGY